MSVHAWLPIPTPPGVGRGGYGFVGYSSGGVGAVTQSDVNELDGAISNLNTDIFQTPEPPGHALDPKPMAWRKYKIDWTQYRINWTAWKESHSLLTSFDVLFGEAETEFNGFKVQYNEFRRRLAKDFGGSTDAPRASSPDPIGEITSAAPTLLITGAVLLGGYWLLGMGGLAMLQRGMASGGNRR